MLLPAIEIYRERFRPSEQLAAPHVMLGVNCVAAETDAEARFLFSSLQQNTLRNRTGQRGRVPPPVENFEEALDPYARAIVADALGCRGRRRTARRCARVSTNSSRVTGADELMVTANIFDHEKRKRSFEIVAELHGGMKPPRAGRLRPKRSDRPWRCFRS